MEKTLFAQALAHALNKDPETLLSSIEVPPDSKLGDYAFPCFILAKELRKSPQQIALDLAHKIKLPALFSRAAATGPYVNVFISRAGFFSKILSETKTRSARKERIFLEYMSANPNKPLHIGQGRNMCIGDSLVRVFRHMGYQTHAATYGDDSGIVVGYNMAGHLYYGIPVETTQKFDHYCGSVYTQMRKRDEDPVFKKQLSEITLAIEKATDKKILEFHSQFIEKCALAQLETCWRMGCFFDLVNWETDILHMHFFEKMLKLLEKEKSILKVQEGKLKGCVVFDLSNHPDFKDLQNPFQVLVKSDGVATYCGKDIAYALWKLGVGEDFYYRVYARQQNNQTLYSTSSSKNIVNPGFGKYDTAIAVIDSRQEHPQKVVAAALEVLGVVNDSKAYRHLSYGVVYLTPKTLVDFGFMLSEEEKKESRLPFATRKGWFVSVDDTLDKLRKTAYEETKKRNPDKGQEWMEQTAEQIAIGSLRFFLTKFDELRDIVFDSDEALDLEGETGSYVMYTYARLANMFAKAEAFSSEKFDLLTDEREFLLAKKIEEFDAVIDMVGKQLAPHHLCRYMLDLSQLVNSYYANVRILQAEPEVRDARLMLLARVKETLAQCMNLVGVPPVERM